MQLLKLHGEWKGKHMWKDAPARYAKLGVLHKHTFVFNAWIVTKADRQVEFLDLAATCTTYLRRFLQEHPGSSCETMATALTKWLQQKGHWTMAVEVLEDGKCGAVQLASDSTALALLVQRYPFMGMTAND